MLSASEFRQKKAQIDQLRLEAEKRRLKQAKESKKRRRVNVLSFDDDDADREEETNTEGLLLVVYRKCWPQGRFQRFELSKTPLWIPRS